MHIEYCLSAWPKLQQQGGGWQHRSYPAVKDRAWHPLKRHHDTSQDPDAHWNPFEHAVERLPDNVAMRAYDFEPSSPVALGMTGGSLITAPAGSIDPFMPPPPPPPQPETQLPPPQSAFGAARMQNAAATPAAAGELTVAVREDGAAAPGRIQTPEQLRQRFAGSTCSLRLPAACDHLLRKFKVVPILRSRLHVAKVGSPDVSIPPLTLHWHRQALALLAISINELLRHLQSAPALGTLRATRSRLQAGESIPARLGRQRSAAPRHPLSSNWTVVQAAAAAQPQQQALTGTMQPTDGLWRAAART